MHLKNMTTPPPVIPVLERELSVNLIMEKIHRCNPAGFAALVMQNSYKCKWKKVMVILNYDRKAKKLEHTVKLGLVIVSGFNLMKYN